MTAFECANDMVLDDAGLMFPDDNHPGVVLVPVGNYYSAQLISMLRTYE